MIEVEIDDSIYLDVYKPIVNSDADMVFLWGGRDSGKTHHIAQELIVKCMESDYFRCILIKKTYESIKDAQWQTIKDIVEDWGISHLFSFREHPLEIRCINGNKFIARGCDKPEKMKSIRNPTDAWYEEMDQISSSDHITVQTTLRNDKGKVKEWCSFNPECKEVDHKDAYLYQFVKDRYHYFRDERKMKIGNDEVSLVIDGVHSTADDNLYCTPDRKARHEALKDTDPYYYDVYRLGLWGKKQVTNPFAIHFDYNKHVSEVAQFNPSRFIYISLDFNLDPFGFIFSHKWADKEGYHRHQFDEAKISNGDIEAGIDWIKNKYGKYRSQFVITGDNMGSKRDFGRRDKASYYERIKSGLNLSPKQIEIHPNPKHVNSRSDVNYILFHHPDWKIHPSCKESIYDMMNVEVDAFGSILKRDRNNVSQRADFLDCIRYESNDKFMQNWIKGHQSQAK